MARDRGAPSCPEPPSLWHRLQVTAAFRALYRDAICTDLDTMADPSTGAEIAIHLL